MNFRVSKITTDDTICWLYLYTHSFSYGSDRYTDRVQLLLMRDVLLVWIWKLYVFNGRIPFLTTKNQLYQNMPGNTACKMFDLTQCVLKHPEAHGALQPVRFTIKPKCLLFHLQVTKQQHYATYGRRRRHVPLSVRITLDRYSLHVLSTPPNHSDIDELWFSDV